ncbi:ubiquitin carboxyl-terminal hydrolase 9 [Ricinus communis]|uniref:Ubiquitin carboxyl-terminal hydrolase n=1 Tax=Ricinus communis TaxID=3988 RepID=B9RYW0_RICCO|nr:ubiquitin carboxyl-terminal hydrolase 9 [Ricinus communis]XP_015574469.1 ubiquitin carboxyl-terminal hydrolase 9 [Ricinus communis]EEF43462.1 Ubiquitin carboxyl-terminal hydrolase, putative [Ricinus communis]|eukprot:XP_002518929.1 ubiquitin carboxyl-terminal hydrolase 9 [Ricinus communis]
MTMADSECLMENGESSCLPCTPHEEQQIVKELMNEAELDLKEGNLYYVVSARWFAGWQRYVGQGNNSHLVDGQPSDSQHLHVVPLTVADRPGPIDNSDLVQNGSNIEADDLELSRTLLEGRDYVLVPQKVWDKLVQWYKGGPTLPRKMISQGVSNKKQFNVEVYPLCLKLVDSRDDSEFTIRLSKKASLHQLFERVCALKGTKQEKIIIWDYYNKRRHSQLIAANRTLEESNLQMDQEILLEVQGDGPYLSQSGKDSTGNELALVALEPARTSLSIAGGPTLSNGHSSTYGLNLRPGGALSTGFTDNDDASGAYTAVRRSERGGLAGLQNMGNTCFMNSALQCLVHTPPLVDYFLKDYSDEINAENPLGMHGELALAFGDLLRKLWSSGRTTFAPRVFKGKLALFAPQFSGYNQHDSQELLAFLLDGLHEDLNRVKQKPYIEMKDWGGRPDEEVADECWRNHKARNDSVIVDVCQGQYKSTLVCPVCSKISITFDPFMYLSLPLPSTVTRSMTITVFYGDGSALPMPYTVSVLKNGHCRDLTQALAAACCLGSEESLLLAEVYDHRIYRLFENPYESLVSIKDEEYIVAYRLSQRDTGKKKLEIINQEKSALDLRGSGWKDFGAPLLTCLQDDSPSGADIELAVSRLLSPLRRTCSSSVAHIHSGKENGFLLEANDRPSNSCNGSPEQEDQPMENVEPEDTSNQELSFRLFLTDDRCSTHKPILRDSVIKSGGSRMKVFLEWTEMEHKTYDPCYLKDLPVVYHKTGFTAKKTRQEAVSLFSCLEAFLTEEPLGPDDMWYCPGCKEHRQATKKLDLWTLPEILVFHLKRFSYSRYLKNKLDTFVDFPIHNLDLSKFVKRKDDRSYVYELYAISNHYGGLGGGHYTAFAKLMDESRWYNFDDSRVSPVNEADIKTSAAYVLFYRRVGTETKAGLGETSQG